MVEMCSESSSPMFSHVSPPSVLLYTPSPYPTWRPPTFSPVPTQTTFGLFGSTSTDPIEYDVWSSKIGSKVVPSFVIFQTLPDPTATYQMLSSSGWNSMSAIRPPLMAGPMLRSSRAS